MNEVKILATKEHKDRNGDVFFLLRSLRSFVAITLFAACPVFAEEKSSAIATFNTACELYRSKDYPESAKLFGEVAAQSVDEKLKAKALYNRGTALLAGTVDGSVSNRINAVAESINVFEQALELTPDDLDCKQNLERALNIMVSNRINHAEKLLDEVGSLLEQFHARSAKENSETAMEVLSPVLEDFAPDHPAVQPLIDRADSSLQMLERAIEQTKEEMKNVRHAIDLYEYQAAADVMLNDTKERRWAFDLDKELAQEFQQMVQNNQNVINIVYPQVGQ